MYRPVLLALLLGLVLCALRVSAFADPALAPAGTVPIVDCDTLARTWDDVLSRTEEDPPAKGGLTLDTLRQTIERSPKVWLRARLFQPQRLWGTTGVFLSNLGPLDTLSVIADCGGNRVLVAIRSGAD